MKTRKTVCSCQYQVLLIVIWGFWMITILPLSFRMEVLPQLSSCAGRWPWTRVTLVGQCHQPTIITSFAFLTRALHATLNRYVVKCLSFSIIVYAHQQIRWVEHTTSSSVCCLGVLRFQHTLQETEIRNSLGCEVSTYSSLIWVFSPKQLCLKKCSIFCSDDMKAGLWLFLLFWTLKKKNLHQILHPD